MSQFLLVYVFLWELEIPNEYNYTIPGCCVLNGRSNTLLITSVYIHSMCRLQTGWSLGDSWDTTFYWMPQIVWPLTSWHGLVGPLCLYQRNRRPAKKTFPNILDVSDKGRGHCNYVYIIKPNVIFWLFTTYMHCAQEHGQVSSVKNFI